MTPSERPELVFGLVAGAGAPLDDLMRDLTLELELMGYKSAPILLSKFLQRCEGWTTPPATELDRIKHHQALALDVRSKSSDGALLARASMAEIRKHRAIVSGSPDRPAPATAFLLKQIKNTDEIELLRSVYGPAFYLIAGHLRQADRVEALVKQTAAQLNGADRVQLRERTLVIVDADEKEPSALGQNTRDAIPQADVFVDLRPGLARASVARFVELIFGHPYHSPTPEEHSMFQAHAVSLRSADYNRQVGAAIVRLKDRTATADVLAVGMNEVPRRGGGYYWPNDSPDLRDQNLEVNDEDRPAVIKVQALEQLVLRIRELGMLNEECSARQDFELTNRLLPTLRGTHFMNISEFSRPVHAELAALLDAARRGVAVDGQLMFVTTFPCHNCAKHIIAAGIKRVYFLEPYPKSRAGYLFEEEILVDPPDDDDPLGRVIFSAFLGIGPRLYTRLFSMAERGAKRGVKLGMWSGARTSVTPILVPSQYGVRVVAAERAALDRLDEGIFKWDKGEICP